MIMTCEKTEVSKPFSTEEEMVSWFMAWEKASRDTIDVKRCYVDMVGDLSTGVLLSQIIYWFLLSSEGKSKLSVNREGRDWLAKGRRAWWNECRVSEKQFDRSIKILRDKGLVETRLWQFGKRGTPTIHICLNWPAVVQGVKCILPKGQNALCPNGKMHFDEKVKSSKLNHAPLDYKHRILTENTNIIYEEEGEDSTLKPSLSEATIGNFVICGYTDSYSERPFGSLILGLPAKEGLRWVGNCGGGFKRTGMETIPKLYEHLQDIRIDHTPLEPRTDITRVQRRRPGIQWVMPVLVCQVKYNEITSSGMLYEAMFRRLRPDLKPGDASYDGSGMDGNER